MSQHDYQIDNQSRTAARADINAALLAIVSQNSGPEPTVKFAYMPWSDIPNDIFKIRNAANTGWVSIFTLSTGALIGQGLGTPVSGNLSNCTNIPGAQVTGTVSAATTATNAETADEINSTTNDIINYNGNPILAFGDSFTAGQGASAANFAYINRLAKILNVAVTNNGVSGSASWKSTYQLFNMPVSASQAVNQDKELVTWMAAFNDVYRGGAAVKTLSKIKGELRSFLSARFSNFAIAGGSVASVTGSWVNLSAHFAGNASRGERSLGGIGRSTVTNGSTMTQIVAGDNVVVHTFATDGIAALSGSFTVKIDGLLMATYAGNGLADGISDGVYNNQITHDAVVITGLGAGNHTVLITAIADATHPVYIDSIESMMPATKCAPVIVAEGAFQNAAGWALGGGIWSQSAMQASTVAVKATVEEFFGYPIAIAHTNKFFNTLNGVASDNNHPNDTGHAQIAAAFSSAMVISQDEFDVSWTPNNGAGLAVVGAFSSSGKYSRIGRQCTVTGTVTGGSSVAVGAGGEICSNAPFSASTLGLGSAGNAAANVGAVITVTSTSIRANAAIGTTPSIIFSITYTF